MPQAAAQGHHSHRDAETDQIPVAAGEYCQEHRCVCVCPYCPMPGGGSLLCVSQYAKCSWIVFYGYIVIKLLFHQI